MRWHTMAMARALAGMLALALLLSGCQAAASGARRQIVPTYALTYAAVGASDAFGVGTDDPADESWPSVLARDLSDHTHLINLGIPGATVAEAQRVEMPIALAAHPAIITVWLAINDYEAQVPLAAYQQQLAALLTSLHSATSARIYTGNLPDLTQLPFFAGRDQTQLRQDVAQWNAAIAEVCAATNTHLVDIHAAFAEVAQHPEYLSDDGLHPSPAGAQRLAAYFMAAMGSG
jgi:acyl-CoA thioesterase I